MNWPHAISREHLAAALFALPHSTIAHLGAILRPMLPAELPSHGDEIADLVADITKPNIGIGLGLDRKIVAVNRFLGNMVGYQPHELAGQDVSLILAGPPQSDPVTYRVFNGVYRHRNGYIIPARTVAIPLVTALTNKLVLVQPQ